MAHERVREGGAAVGDIPCWVSRQEGIEDTRGEDVAVVLLDVGDGDGDETGVSGEAEQLGERGCHAGLAAAAAPPPPVM
ncbi:hypothetical protein CH63R_03430 [Colletotrichum higginsianum IMI 349063]|uniref:Uncharacterized protein n=1 Tax=Colletotrichum higginsianum (strain IMI 349063) TaxID=759273 RepID=A0A1B7YRX5_COLHI|nr:hypothetical protein CH63R_03430 [Colletotrichum higginsianum IMI 349063]OBR14704.1 hypothetical protein CH63R_03430 [Colletotrichum higginsianum IMI 349063]